MIIRKRHIGLLAALLLMAMAAFVMIQTVGVFADGHDTDLKVTAKTYIPGDGLPPGNTVKSLAQSSGIQSGTFTDADVTKPLGVVTVEWMIDDPTTYSHFTISRAAEGVSADIVVNTPHHFTMTDVEGEYLFEYHDWDVLPGLEYSWYVTAHLTDGVPFVIEESNAVTVESIHDLYGYVSHHEAFLFWEPIEDIHSEAKIFRYDSGNHEAGLVEVDIQITSDTSGIDITLEDGRYYVYEVRYISKLPPGYPGPAPVDELSNQIVLNGTYGLPDSPGEFDPSFVDNHTGQGHNIFMEWHEGTEHYSHVGHYEIYHRPNPQEPFELIGTTVAQFWIDFNANPNGLHDYLVVPINLDGSDGLESKTARIGERGYIICTSDDDRALKTWFYWMWLDHSGGLPPATLEGSYALENNVNTFSWVPIGLDLYGWSFFCIDMESFDFEVKRRITYLHKADESCGVADADGVYPSCDIYGGLSDEQYSPWVSTVGSQTVIEAKAVWGAERDVFVSRFPPATEPGIYQYEYEVCSYTKNPICSEIGRSAYEMVGLTGVPR